MTKKARMPTPHTPAALQPSPFPNIAPTGFVVKSVCCQHWLKGSLLSVLSPSAAPT